MKKACWHLIMLLFLLSLGNETTAQVCGESFCSLIPRSVSSEGAYRKNLKRWSSSVYEHALTGTSWLGPIEGNGFTDRKHYNNKRDTLIYIPQHLRRDSKVTLVLWIHGLSGFRLDKERLAKSILELDRKQKNYVLVAPEMPWSANTSTRRGRQFLAWNSRISKNENLEVFYDRVLSLLRNKYDISPNEKIVIGHSAGGSAIKNAALSGTLSSLAPDKIVFSDAGYGRWTQQVWNFYLRHNRECQFILLVRKWDTPYKNTILFLKRLRRQENGKLPKNILFKVFLGKKGWTHKRIGDTSIYMNIVWEK